MQLKEITIENFKGIKGPLNIKLKPIVLLFGPNSSGKSSIIQAINYARDIFTSGGNVDPETQNSKNTDLGNYRNITNNHDLSKPVSFEFLVESDQVDDFLRLVSSNIDTNLSLSEGDYGFKDSITLCKSLPNVESLIWSEIQYIMMKIKSISLRLTVLWNQKNQQPELQKIEVKANGLPLYLIGRDIETRDTKLSVCRKISDPDIVKISFYNHPLLPEKVISSILEQNYLMIYNLASNRKGFEFDSLKKSYTKECNAFKGKNTHHKILFTTILNQTSAFPDLDHSILFTDRYNLGFCSSSDHDHPMKKSFFINFFSALVTTPVNTLTWLFKEFEHIGPLREMPSRNFSPTKDPESFRWNTGLAAYDVLQHPSTTDDFIKELNRWLLSEDCLNTGYFIELKKYSLVNEQSLLWSSIDDLDDLQDVNKIKEIIKEELMRERKIEFKIKDKNSMIELLPQDIGTGISQILPIVIGSLWLQGKRITIEQPELHIHPAIQSEMADLFIKYSSSNKENNYYSHLEALSAEHSLNLCGGPKESDYSEIVALFESLLEEESLKPAVERVFIKSLEDYKKYKNSKEWIESIHSAKDTVKDKCLAIIAKDKERENDSSNSFILETHSEHLMLRLLRRIRETADKENEKDLSLSPEDIAVYYMKNGKNGVKATHIIVNDEGDFDSPWPDGFFSERSKELF